MTPAQPHGTSSSFWNVQPGTGHSIGSQLLGRVVCVTVGQTAGAIVVGWLGSVVMLMMNDVVVEELKELMVGVGEYGGR